MNRFSPNEYVIDSESSQLLWDDNGDPIGARRALVDEGMPASTCDGLVHALATLTSVEIAEVLANRSIIERAKGMLMVIYDVDADGAFDLLRLRSQETNVKLLSIARQLVDEFPTLTAEQRMPTPAGYDFVLRTVHERIPVEVA